MEKRLIMMSVSAPGGFTDEQLAEIRHRAIRKLKYREVPLTYTQKWTDGSSEVLAIYEIYSSKVASIVERFCHTLSVIKTAVMLNIGINPFIVVVCR